MPTLVQTTVLPRSWVTKDPPTRYLELRSRPLPVPIQNHFLTAQVQAEGGMTFREQATADLPTFLNVDEFANGAVIDGVVVDCVLEGNGDTQGSNEGVIDVDTIIRARVSAFDQLPVVGQRIVVDGRPADVVAASEDQGMAEIRTRWMDS
jgi:hypothetical protein